MKMSRTDILVAAIRNGLSDDQAEDIMYDLSPESGLVPESKVAKAIAEAVARNRWEEGR